MSPAGDPSSEKAVRQLLRELREATTELQEAVQKLDARTKTMRTGIAHGIAQLLHSCAGWSEDEVKQWHDKHTRG